MKVTIVEGSVYDGFVDAKELPIGTLAIRKDAPTDQVYLRVFGSLINLMNPSRTCNVTQGINLHFSPLPVGKSVLLTQTP